MITSTIYSADFIQMAIKRNAKLPHKIWQKFLKSTCACKGKSYYFMKIHVHQCSSSMNMPNMAETDL